jgi:hypothetical protein
MQSTALHLSTAFEIGDVDPRIFAGFLDSFIRHADVVKVANLSPAREHHRPDPHPG